MLEQTTEGEYILQAAKDQLYPLRLYNCVAYTTEATVSREQKIFFSRKKPKNVRQKLDSFSLMVNGTK